MYTSRLIRSSFYMEQALDTPNNHYIDPAWRTYLWHRIRRSYRDHNLGRGRRGNLSQKILGRLSPSRVIRIYFLADIGPCSVNSLANPWHFDNPRSFGDLFSDLLFPRFKTDP